MDIRDDSRRATSTRIVLGLFAVPLAMFFAVSIAGAGNLPLGGIVGLPSLYLLGVLLADARSAFTRHPKARPSYLVWWTLAALPAVIWLLWLALGS
jgi:hypothetical protein